LIRKRTCYAWMTIFEILDVLLKVLNTYIYNVWNYNFYVYIITNPSKTTLYTGVTNDLNVRLQQHQEKRGNTNSFAGKFHCYLLLYYEHFTNIEFAIEREKEIKAWRREKKEKLISSTNPEWKFLNGDVCN
jgi:putative endonuclease